jgi:hypothetical protein
LDTRTAFFYGVTGITPAMAMRMTGIGSQYLLAMVDADKNYFDGAKTYRVTLPKGIPLPARRQSELSVTGRQARRRRLDDHSLPRYSPQASSAATFECFGLYSSIRSQPHQIEADCHQMLCSRVM